MTELDKPKRFYKDVAVEEHEGAWRVLLDGRAARTKGRRYIAAPNRALGEAVADEWRAQCEHIDQITMPLTRLLSGVIDAEEGAVDDWRRQVLEYLGTDLVCYRAEAPAELVKAQAEAWDPYLDGFAATYGLRLNVTAGVSAIAQPDEANEAVDADLRKVSVEALFGLQIATAISGSAVLALSLLRSTHTPDQIFNASRIDEHFQEERWGVDEDAKAREKLLSQEFLDVARFIALSME